MLKSKSIFVGFTVPPSIEDVEEISIMILKELPKGLFKYTGKLKIVVEDFPDSFIEQEMELENSFELLGCYQGSGVSATTKQADTLYLYRRPLLDIWAETGEDITNLINRVMLREIGNHFGFSNNEIDMYEEDMFGATALNAGAI